MKTPLTDDEAIAAITQLANRPWDQGSVSHKEKVRRDNLLANRLREIVTRKARPKK